MDFTIEEMKAINWDQISQIYMEGIDTDNATFETKLPSWSSWISSHISGCNIIAR